MSFKKKFFKNVLIYGSYTFSTQFVIFLTSLATSRLLLPADFGLVALITVFSNFINIFSDSGISYAVIRSPYLFTYYRGLNTISLLLGVLLCVVFIALIYPIFLFYKNPAIILPGIAIGFLFIARSINIVPIAILQKQLNFSSSGKPVFIATIVSACCTIIMALMGFGYWSLIWAQFINSFVTTFLLYRKSSVKMFSFRKPVFAKSFHLTKSLIGSITGFNTISYWSKNSDNLIVGKYYGSNDLGIYNRAYLMLTLPVNLVTGLFSSVLYPSLIKHKNEGGNVEGEYYFILKILALLTFPLSIILILFPDLFVKILWGKNWMMVAKLLPYFGLLIMTQTINSTMGSLLILEKKEKTLMYTGWITSALLIAGIIYGATISLVSIGAFYALAYIALVMPFNIIYVFRLKLNYVSGIITFWLPKILFSFLIWMCIYYNYNKAVIVLIIIWAITLLLNARAEIAKAYSYVIDKRFKT